jgi:hypothetical protein
VLPLLGSRHDRVEVAEAQVRLGEPEVVGKLLPGRLLDDARSGEGKERTGLGDRDVAQRREAREHARRCRMRHHDHQRAAGVVQQTTREKLPDDFGLAEQNLRFGHLDAIVPRPQQREHLSRLLRLFA